MLALKTCCRCALTALMFAWLPGCQSYERQPLDFDAYRAEWINRVPNSTAVLDYAQQLEERDGSPLTFDPTDGVSIREAEVIALVYNPAVRLARARAHVAEAGTAHAGAWEDPVFGVDVLRITESVPDPWVVSTAVSFSIPLSGRLDVERDIAVTQHAAEMKRALIEEQRVLFELRREWIEWSSNLSRLESGKEFSSSVESFIQAIQQLTEAGEFNRLEYQLVRLDQWTRENQMIGLQSRVLNGEQRIKSLLGLSPDASVSFTPEIPLSLPECVDEQSPESLAQSSLLLSLQQTVYELSEERLHREIRKQYPDVSIGPQHESDNGQSRIGFVFGIPIPILNANKEEIAVARAARDAARIEFESAFEQAVSDFAVVLEQIKSLRDQRAHFLNTLMPLSIEQMEEVILLRRAGEIGAFILLESLQRSYDAQLQLIGINEQVALTTNALYRLLGQRSQSNDRTNRTEGDK